MKEVPVRTLIALAAVLCLGLQSLAQDSRPIRLITDPALSPNADRIAFSYLGDIWVVSSSGGDARRLTENPARDSSPSFSPDGTQIAFLSDRDARRQIHVIPSTGGIPRRVTLNTEGYGLEEWLPDGQGFLTLAQRDHFWRRAARFFVRPMDGKKAEQLLFDGYGRDGCLDAGGNLLLYTREGAPIYRKQYAGSQESQVWLFDRSQQTHRLLRKGNGGCRYPLWTETPGEFLYVSQADGTFNLYRGRLNDDSDQQLTHFKDDGVLFPAISRDGSKVVFRRLFDLYSLDLTTPSQPRLLSVTDGSDPIVKEHRNAVLEAASDVSYSPDGKECCFTSGGDLWVMDTVLREPVRITSSPEEERSPLFLSYDEILFVSDEGGQSDIWRVRRKDADKWFWQQEEFELDKLTDDADFERDLRPVPESDEVCFTRGRGDLILLTPSTGKSRRLLASWNTPQYDFSPDGKWIAYAIEDGNFNRDVYLAPLDGSRAPFNLSRHPDSDSSPAWSHDGKVLAFVGRHWRNEADIIYVHLTQAGEDEDARQRKLAKAIKAMAKRKRAQTNKDEPRKTNPPEKSNKKSADSTKKTKTLSVAIDFEGIRDRFHRISIPRSFESGLFFWPGEDKLCFQAEVDGKRGLYTVTFPDPLRPKLLTSSSLRNRKPLREAKSVCGLSGGSPAVMDKNGRITKHSFRVKISYRLGDIYRVIFDQAWRAMRDGWYDPRMNNKNWDEIRRKYAPVAEQCLDVSSLSAVCNMMLGELNGSHLGFRMSEGSLPGERRPSRARTWSLETRHLGCRFDPTWKGPGLKVKDVIKKTPASRSTSRIRVGEIVLAIDGKPVDPGIDIATVLTVDPDRFLKVKVQDAQGATRVVSMRPTTYRAVRSLLYDRWVADNEKKVEELSGGSLGYLHIRGMNFRSFEKFEEELFRVGYGKDGLVIDVRENGGGSTTDHLLTALTQPEHALTLPRGGTEKDIGYPQGRRIYATWSKPIVVLCNQNSFSNAEIFSHAIKTLKRGRLVGVRTAGGVISTGGMSIMGMAFIRMPFRGWFVLPTGEDMELNGADPDVTLWPAPGEWPSGKDQQLAKAVELLSDDVATWKARPRPKLRYRTER
ncbi:MAG TPA: hypothetical protein ENK43_05410 [Planctomycetes bacterium]|nr:hypothetical protein [Planctomycetota bacterium]